MMYSLISCAINFLISFLPSSLNCSARVMIWKIIMRDDKDVCGYDEGRWSCLWL